MCCSRRRRYRRCPAESGRRGAHRRASPSAAWRARNPPVHRLSRVSCAERSGTRQSAAGWLRRAESSPWRLRHRSQRDFRLRRHASGGEEGTCYIKFSGASVTVTQADSMKIHEYQAKAILAKYAVPVPRGEVAFTIEEAEAAAKSIGGSVVVKAQIHAGGRGKGGGVKVAKDHDDAREIARKILGMTLITHQTGPEGRLVQRLLVEETLPIERELYLGIVLDRVKGKPVFMASAAGGMEIEQVAAENPDAILKEYVDPGMELDAFQARKLAFKLGLSGKLAG